jgi:hypothetical protein
VKRTILLVAFGLVAACGGSPTGPTPAVTQSTTQTTPQPADPPASPAPAPTPAPAPAPAPPAPSPDPAPGPAQTILHATVSTSHWYPGAAFTLPDSFDVVIDGSTAKIATLDPLPFGAFISNDDFIVKQKDFEFTVRAGTFSFNGLAGQASGTIALAK